MFLSDQGYLDLAPVHLVPGVQEGVVYRKGDACIVNPHAGAGTTINISPAALRCRAAPVLLTGIRNPGLRPYLLMPVVPSDGNVSVHASMPIYISAVRGLMQ